MRLLYRTGQFFQAITAQVAPEEMEAAERMLPTEARPLFRRQTVQDRHHALAVYHALCRAGYDDPHLLVAALLHDVGKSAGPLPLLYRVAIVLLGRCCPRLLAHLGREGATPAWRRPFVVHARHAAIGAAWAHEAGCSPLTVALIRRHHDKRVTTAGSPEEHLLTALQAADERS